jgi:hypothetical protein
MPGVDAAQALDDDAQVEGHHQRHERLKRQLDPQLAVRPAFPLVGSVLATVTGSNAWTMAVAAPIAFAVGTGLASAAIAAAVEHALQAFGAHITRTPLRPETILRLMRGILH